MKDLHVRRGAYWMVTALALAVTACGGGDSPTAGGGYGNGGNGGGGGGDPVATTAVNVSLAGFDPESIRVAPGTRVTWTWTDALQHTVTFADPQIADIPVYDSGSYGTLMPAASGTYLYQCSIHLFSGSVLVQ